MPQQQRQTTCRGQPCVLIDVINSATPFGNLSEMKRQLLLALPEEKYQGKKAKEYRGVRTAEAKSRFRFHIVVGIRRPRRSMPVIYGELAELILGMIKFSSSGLSSVITAFGQT